MRAPPVFLLLAAAARMLLSLWPGDSAADHVLSRRDACRLVRWLPARCRHEDESPLVDETCLAETAAAVEVECRDELR
jgi:hypothetical protein